MDKSIRDKIVKQSELNENGSSTTRKSLKKSWLKFGTDRVDMDKESRRVITEVYKLMGNASDPKSKEFIRNHEDYISPGVEDDEPDVNNNVRDPICLDDPRTVIVRGESLTHVNEINPSTKSHKETSSGNAFRYTEKWLVDNKEEFAKSVPKEEILLNPILLTQSNNPKMNIVDKDETKNSLASGSNVQSLKQDVSSTKSQTNTSKQNSNKNSNAINATKKQFEFSARPKVEIFERKLGGSIPRDKSPYSCDITISTSTKDIKKNKVNVSFKDYQMISRMFGSLKNGRPKNHASKGNPETSSFNLNNSQQDTIVPLWSLDRNNKAKLPYPRSSISSQSTQINDSKTQVLNVSQHTSESLLCNNEEYLNPLKTITEKMKAVIYAATEAGIVLMNTVFKYDLTNPNSADIVTEIPQFLEFINAPNELEALDKMAEIYALASTKIKIYKQKLKAKTDELDYPEITQFAAKSSQLLNISSVDSENKQIMGWKCSRANPLWDFDSEEYPKIDVSIANELSGELKEIVSFDRCQYKTTFTGTDSNINVVSKASCQNSCPAKLKPQLLLQMIERTSSHSMNRVIAAKFCCNVVSNRIALTAQHFLDGKYSKAIDENQYSRLLKKLQAINVVSGILQQISHELQKVCTTIQKAIKLDTNEAKLKNHHTSCIPGISPGNNNTIAFPVSAKLNAADTIKILQNAVRELHNILKTGESSLQFVNKGTPIKRHDKKTVKILLDALRYLVCVKDMDFGTMVMTLYCNALLLENLTDIVPSIDSATRFKITASVADLYWGLFQLAQSAKSINTVATFVSVNTLRKIQIINRELKRQLTCVGK